MPPSFSTQSWLHLLCSQTALHLFLKIADTLYSLTNPNLLPFLGCLHLLAFTTESYYRVHLFSPAFDFSILCLAFFFSCFFFFIFFLHLRSLELILYWMNFKVYVPRLDSCSLGDCAISWAVIWSARFLGGCLWYGFLFDFRLDNIVV